MGPASPTLQFPGRRNRRHRPRVRRRWPPRAAGAPGRATAGTRSRDRQPCRRSPGRSVGRAARAWRPDALTLWLLDALGDPGNMFQVILAVLSVSGALVGVMLGALLNARVQ